MLTRPHTPQYGVDGTYADHTYEYAQDIASLQNGLQYPHAQRCLQTPLPLRVFLTGTEHANIGTPPVTKIFVNPPGGIFCGKK